MAYPVFSVPAGDVLPVLFASYAGATGASVTLSGLAVTDIEIFKDGSVTQRASDAGYTLLDTDGIDFDGVTGIHGFSIDTGDNTDAGFYTVGAWFTVVVSAVTIDTQTVNFIACQFRLMPAESVAGKPKVDVDAIGGDAQSLTDLKDFADAGYDPSTNKVQGVVLTDTVTTYTGDTPQTGDSYAIVNSGTHGNAALKTLIDAIDDFLDTEIAAILQDTGTTLDDFIDTEVAAILALLDDPRSEPTQGTPPVNPDLATKIDYLYKAWRNRSTQTASEYALYNDDAVTKDHEAACSDDGTTFVRGEMTTGA